jgi:hypothetical protein
LARFTHFEIPHQCSSSFFARYFPHEKMTAE